jgi:hypothetical protein
MPATRSDCGASITPCEEAEMAPFGSLTPMSPLESVSPLVRMPSSAKRT